MLTAAVATIAVGGTLLSAPVTAPAAVASPQTVQAEGQDARKRVRCGREVATIVGNKRDNILKGTKRRDVIHGRGGHDVVAGIGRRDKVCGGKGNDILDGGFGRDRLWGNRGSDYCIGEKREHRFHRGCEVHAPKVSPPPPPPPGGSPTPRGAQKATLVSTEASSFPLGDSWFQYADPWCERGTIDLNRFWLRGNYTNPAYVYVQTWMYYFDDRLGNFDLQRPAVIDHSWWSMPNDNNFYEVAGRAWNLRTGSSSDGFHAVWWWNGSEWTDLSIYPIDGYHNTVTFMGICIT